MIVNHSVYSKEDYQRIIEPKYLKTIYRKKLFNLIFVAIYYVYLVFILTEPYLELPPFINSILVLIPWSLMIVYPKKVYMKKWMEPTEEVDEIIHHVEFHPNFVKLDINSPKKYSGVIITYDHLIGYFFDEDRLYLLHKSIIFVEIDSFEDKSLRNAVKLLESYKVKKLRYLF